MTTHTLTEADYIDAEERCYLAIVSHLHATSGDPAGAIEAVRWAAVAFTPRELLDLWSRHVSLDQLPGGLDAAAAIELAARHVRREMAMAN